jgi:transposase
LQSWRRAWIQYGMQAVYTKGPSSQPRLTEAEFAALEKELAKGPAAHGWPDQCWTLSRIKKLIGQRFHVTYTLQGVRKLLLRHGFSCCPPSRTSDRRSNMVCGWIKVT